jgi:hypothetical protein
MITAEQVAAINDPEFYSFNEFGFVKNNHKGGACYEWKI